MRVFSTSGVEGPVSRVDLRQVRGRPGPWACTQLHTTLAAKDPSPWHDPCHAPSWPHCCTLAVLNLSSRPTALHQAHVVYDGGCRKGELTRLGQQQARDLGAWLRGRYTSYYGFLPPDHPVRGGGCAKGRCCALDSGVVG